jgi:hypothetical protein
VWTSHAQADKAEKAPRRPLFAQTPMTWSLAPAEPAFEIWTPEPGRVPVVARSTPRPTNFGRAPATTFGKRVVSPFGA